MHPVFHLVTVKPCTNSQKVKYINCVLYCNGFCYADYWNNILDVAAMHHMLLTATLQLFLKYNIKLTDCHSPNYFLGNVKEELIIAAIVVCLVGLSSP